MYESRSLLQSNWSEIGQFEQRVTKLRGQLTKIVSNLEHIEAQAALIRQEVVGLQPAINQYTECFGAIVNLPQCNSSSGPIFNTRQSKPPSNIIINIYLWQLFNFVCINSSQFPTELGSLICPLLQLDLSYEHLHSPNSLKHATIFLHNWLNKCLQQQQLPQHWPHLRTAIGMLVVHQFQRNKATIQECELSSCKKEEAHYLGELQWFGYIMAQLFNKSQSQQRKDSLVRQFIEGSQNQKMPYYMLHTLGNYLENVIQKRVTTELVAGFECQIQDVREMYSKNSNNAIEISISLKDLQYITELYKAGLRRYKDIVQKYLIVNVQNKSDPSELTEEWTKNADLLTESEHLINCVVFIGGYNQPLQDIVIELLLEKDSCLLDHLQLSYLLYRNIESTRYSSKVQMISQMETYAKNKLLSSIQTGIQSKDIDLKKLKLERLMIPGQLVSLLRMLTNLVHISHRGQAPFERDPKYLHMIMSLTHDSVSQATMKEWAIMFIRNVTEWSQHLRDQIAKIKIEMKVE